MEFLSDIQIMSSQLPFLPLLLQGLVGHRKTESRRWNLKKTKAYRFLPIMIHRLLISPIRSSDNRYFLDFSACPPCPVVIFSPYIYISTCMTGCYVPNESHLRYPNCHTNVVPLHWIQSNYAPFVVLLSHM